MNRLVLPIPPSVNASHRNVAINRRIKTSVAQSYISTAGWTAKAWIQQNGWKMPDKTTKVIMRVWIWWPDKRRRDPDNLLKILSDSFTKVVYVDDCMVLPQIIDFQVDRERPRIEIEFEALEAIDNVVDRNSH